MQKPAPHRVSIRSPHRSKGRRPRRRATRRSNRFQSAPLTEARGDLLLGTMIEPSRSVSIRSPHRSKGRHDWSHRLDRTMRVSIRSPHRSKGRPSSLCSLWLIRSGFNPLPSPKQGETYHKAVSNAQIAVVSIRSPHRSKGRPATKTSQLARQAVSIRSPHRSKGRLSTIGKEIAYRMFQSAPLTEARGDTLYGFP